MKAKLTVEPNSHVFTVERTFDAPRDKVFKAMTTKELVEKWWIGPGYEVEVEELDAREGGRWKYTQRKGDEVVSFFGSFHEVSPERIVQTFEFSGLPERGHVAMEKAELTEKDGKTTLFVTDVFFSVEDRDGMIASGMEEGMNNTYDSLDKVLADME